MCTVIGNNTSNRQGSYGLSAWLKAYDEDPNLSYTVEQIISKDVKFQETSVKDGGTNVSRSHVNLSTGKKTNSTSTVELEEPQKTLWAEDNVRLGWKSIEYRGSGFINLGNTCYMNSSLQALFHVPSFANWLRGDVDAHRKVCRSQYNIFCSICSMMELLRITSDQSSNPIKPSLIHNKIKSISSTLSYHRQEDAHEFTKMLLSHMERAYISTSKGHQLDHRSKETTPLNQIFGGYIRQQVICPSCRHASTTFSHFQDLCLDVHDCNNIGEALSQYFRKEVLDWENAYKCEGCNKKVSATKKHLIERAPPVLMLQLKRFTPSGQKIGRRIMVPHELNMSPYIRKADKFYQAQGYKFLYQLTSMVIHIGGSQDSGHYIAMGKASNGTMFEFDDSYVKSVNLNNALNSNPYLVFYELKSKPNTTSVPTSLHSKPEAKANKQKGERKSFSPLPPKSEREKITIKMPNTYSGKPDQKVQEVSRTKLEDNSWTTHFSSVTSWDGAKSTLGSEIEKDKAKYLHRSELDRYNEDYDSGKYPKKKRKNLMKREENNKQSDKFQRFLQKSSSQYRNPFHSAGTNYKRHPMKPKFNHHRSWRDKNSHPYNRSHSQKPWFDKNRIPYKKDLYA